jgi:hypothetical protein
MRLLSVTLSIIAGLLGGFVEQYLFVPASVHAQAEVTAPTMFDANGKAIFTSAEKAIVKPATAR